MKTPRVTLDQWRALLAVVDEGGFAQAAGALHRSQSSVSHAVQRLQAQLGVDLLQVHGRKAELTPAGQAVLERARALVVAAGELEALARHVDEGWEAEIRLVVDAAFPSDLLMQALRDFLPISQGTRVQLIEEVLSGVEEALVAGEADLAIAARVPAGRLGEPLLAVEFVAVTHPGHPLQRQPHQLNSADLSGELQVVVRDSGIAHKQDVGWLNAGPRWTVTSLDSALEAVSNGLGFAWLPTHQVKPLLEAGELTPLRLREGQRYFADLYLVFGEPDRVGPATRQLADILQTHAARGQSREPR